MKVWYDERNTLFSRIQLKKSTPDYQTYYHNHPDLRMMDDVIRGGAFRQALRQPQQFKDLFFPITASNKALIKSMHETVDNTPLGKKVEVPQSFKKNIIEITKHFGASHAGVVKLNARHFYTHRGGVNEPLESGTYGDPITPSYTHAIVYLVPMDVTYINRAPHFEELLETENAYIKIPFIGSRLALYLKNLGYKSTFQSDMFYLTPLVPLAYDAGLGEIGMVNHLVNPEHGDNVRIGAVLTNLALPEDKPINFGLEAFCKRCALCVMNCPSRSITPRKREVNGRGFYKFDDQTCFELWKKTGTDCGTCIQSCPFTQGIDTQTIEAMKNNPDLIDGVIKDHIKKHTRRRFTKDPLPIVSLERDKS